jgi:putative FmdB family regulatory protein
MPIYEYACQKCEKRTEAIQRVGEKPLRICPHCGGRLKKLASAPAIQFKGSGWYVTDYAGGDRAGKEKSEKSDKSPEKSSPEKSSSEKGETSDKPAEKKKEAKEKKASKE